MRLFVYDNMYINTTSSIESVGFILQNGNQLLRYRTNRVNILATREKNDVCTVLCSVEPDDVLAAVVAAAAAAAFASFFVGGTSFLSSDIFFVTRL